MARPSLATDVAGEHRRQSVCAEWAFSFVVLVEKQAGLPVWRTDWRPARRVIQLGEKSVFRRGCHWTEPRPTNACDLLLVGRCSAGPRRDVAEIFTDNLGGNGFVLLSLGTCTLTFTYTDSLSAGECECVSAGAAARRSPAYRTN